MAADRLERAPARDRRRRGHGQLRRDGRGSAAPLCPRPLRRLAELPREHPLLRENPPRDRGGPAGLRLQPDAAVADLDPGLRPIPARLLRTARRRPLLARRQLHGRVHRNRGRDHRAGPGGRSRADFRRGRHLGPRAPRRGRDGRPGGQGSHARPDALPDAGDQAPGTSARVLPGRLLRPEQPAAGDALGERRARAAESWLLRRAGHTLGI